MYSIAPADWVTRTLIGEFLPLCKDTVCVSYSSSRLGLQDTHWRILIPLQRYSICILQLQWTGSSGHSLENSYPSAEIQYVYSIAPADWVFRTLIGEFLSLCRDTVCVSYSSSRLGLQDTHWRILIPLQRYSICILQLQPTGSSGHSLENSYPSAEIQYVYSTAPADWVFRTLIGEFLPLCRDTVCVSYSSSRLGLQDTHWRILIPLQRYSMCILQLQPTGSSGHSLENSYPSAEIQYLYSTAPVDWVFRTLIGEFLSLCRDTVCVFYSSSRLGLQDTHWRILIPLQRYSICILQLQRTLSLRTVYTHPY